MEGIEFEEGQRPDIDTLRRQLFGNEADPTSFGYKRIHIRPTVHWLKILANCLIPLGVLALLGWWLTLWGVGAGWAVGVCLVVLLGYCLLRGKDIAICMVRIYQRYAPESLRNKCRFEPSCSQYMVLSLQKYGLFKGLAKGIDRLKRCGPGDGGYDEP